MQTNLDGNVIKAAILNIISKIEKDNQNSYSIKTTLQSTSILDQVSKDLNIRGDINEQLLLTVFSDLFRTGYLSWGMNLCNQNPPFFHVTEQGRAILKNLSRDPTNSAGYMEYLNKVCKLNKVAQTYLDESLQAFNANFYKSAAVMIGCAAESILIDLANFLHSRLSKPTKKLTDWKTKTVLNSIKSELDQHKSTMLEDLSRRYEVYWPSFNEQIRKTRNDAGHPENIEIFTFEDVHASLLIFPELALLTSQLKKFISDKIVK